MTKIHWINEKSGKEDDKVYEFPQPFKDIFTSKCNVKIELTSLNLDNGHEITTLTGVCVCG